MSANESEETTRFPDPQLQLLMQSAGFALILWDSVCFTGQVQTANCELRSSETVPSSTFRTEKMESKSLDTGGEYCSPDLKEMNIWTMS